MKHHIWGEEIENKNKSDYLSKQYKTHHIKNKKNKKFVIKPFMDKVNE